MRKFCSFLLFFVICFAGYAQAQNTVVVQPEDQPIIKNEENKDDNSTTIDELKAKADKGDVEAQLNLGYMYLYGINGINIDYKQALAYYEEAAKQDSAIANNNLGSLYFSGIGTDINYDKAIYFFDKATSLGSHDAAVNLAIIYLNANHDGNKSDKDFGKIADLLKQAQEDNNIAKYLLGYGYYKGLFGKKNMTEVFQLVKAAADGQYDEAQYVLAKFYLNGYGTPKNYARAVEYLQKASDQGNPEAITTLADILAEGKIYKQDIKKAHVLYNVAAVMGADNAAEKRDTLETNLSIEDLLSIQALAENYKETPSEQTSLIRRTFGKSLKAYIDSNIVENNISNKSKDVSK